MTDNNSSTSAITQDLTNQTFNRLTVIRYAYKRIKDHFWECRCVCGNIKTIRGAGLKNGHTKSCGCLQRQHVKNLGQTHKTHGQSKTTEYKIFCGAKKRCTNSNGKSYADYGGRGIEFRFKSFEEFFADVGFRPSPQHSLERKNNNGHYEKGNCEWATKIKQARNTRTNRYLTYNGKTCTAAEWGDITGLKSETIRARIARGACVPCALTIPLGAKCPHR